MRKFADSNPAFIILFFVICAFIWSDFIQPNTLIFYSILISASIFSVILFYKRYFFSAKFLLAILIGISLNFIATSNFTEFPSKIIPEMKAIFDGEITKKLYENDKLIRVLCSGNIDAQSLNKIDNANIVINVFKKDNNLKLSAGQKIFAKIKINFPQKNQFNSGFSERQYLMGLNAKFSAISSEKDIAILGKQNSFYELIQNITNSLKSKIDILFDDNSNAIINAVILGDKSGLTAELKEIFSLSGTAHVLAVSGLHTGIIASIIFVFLGFVSNRIIKLIIFSVSILLFVIISGMQDSAIRAAILSICILLAYTFQFRYNLLNIFSFAILLIIIFSPQILYSTGFQMSVVSVGGIILFYEPIRSFIMGIILIKSRIYTFIINSIAVTFAASITISPVVAYYFGIYSFVSPLSNLLIIPIFSLTLIFSIVAIFFSYINLEIASYYSSVVDLLIKISEYINSYSISLPNSYLIDESAFIISLIISIAILYIINSYNNKGAIFRVIASITIVSISIILFDSQMSNSNIYARQQFTSLILPMKDDFAFVLVADRKPSQTPKRDFEFEKYLLSINKKLIIGYNGNAGINLCDNLKKQTSIAEKNLSLKQIEFLETRLNLKTPISQIIGIK